MATKPEQKVKCTRCRNIHLYSERVKKQDKKKWALIHIVCPRCEARDYYENW